MQDFNSMAWENIKWSKCKSSLSISETYGCEKKTIKIKKSKMVRVFKKAFNWYFKVYYEVYKPMIEAGINPSL